MKKVEVITYSLRGTQRSSDRYYDHLIGEHRDVLVKGKEITQLIERFQAFIEGIRCEEVCFHEEDLFEPPTLGMLCRRYRHERA